MAVVTTAGFASRSGHAANWPEFIRAYAGDTLWALMVFLALGFIFPRASTIRLAATALLIAIGAECSQLIDHPAINKFRNTWLGSILLGHDFMWSDWLCYAAGITAGTAGEFIVSSTFDKAPLK
jgi:hypothetical protein